MAREPFEYDEFDDDLDDGPVSTVVCPECGSDDLEVISEDGDGNFVYECNDCGERFTDGEEEA